MVEEFFKFQDNKENCTSSPSRTFEDFEEEWLQLDHDLSVVFDSGNSPKDPNRMEENKSNNPHQIQPSEKGKLSEIEDSLIVTRKKMAKNWGFTQQKDEEDPLLKTFRQEKPEKYQALEKRTCNRSTFILESPRVTAYSLTSQEFSPTSQGTPAASEDYRIDYFTQLSPAKYPLQEELTALGQLVDSDRVDLLETSMLVNHIQDYLKKKWK